VIEGEGVTKSGRAYWNVLKPGAEKTTRIYKDSSGIRTQETIEIEDDYTSPLRSVYKEYLTALGKQYNNDIDETTFDKSFQEFKDFYGLGVDQKNLSSTVSFMMNPEGHYAYVEKYNELAKKKREAMGEEIRAQLKQYQKGTEENDLIEMLAKNYNVYIEQDDLEALIKDDIPPTEFYNVDNDAPLKHDSQTYTDVKDGVRNWMIDTKRVEEAPAAEETKEETTEETAAVAEDVITLDTTLDQYPDGLVALMQAEMDAYNKTFDERENLSAIAKKNAKINDLETFITSDATKARVRKVLKAWNPTEAVKPAVKPAAKPEPAAQAEKPAEAAKEEVVEESSIDTDLVDPEAKETDEKLTEISLPIVAELKNLLIDKKLRLLALGATEPQLDVILKGLIKGKVLKPGQKIGNLQIGAKFSIPVVDSNGLTRELVFVYTGLKNVIDAGGQHQMIMDLQLQTEKSATFPFKVMIGEDTYYAATKNQQAWIEGDTSKVLHTFNLREVRGVVDEVSGETDAVWRKEVRERFANSTDIETTLSELQTEDTKRDIDGKISIGSEEMFIMYEDALKKYHGELTPAKLILQDEYKMKGKLRKFGTAKVSKKTKKGVEFTSTGKATLGQTAFIETKYLPEVIEKKLMDLDEDIAAEGLEEVTEADKELLNESSEEREELSGEEMDQAAEEFNSMSRADRLAKMKQDRENTCK